MFCEKSGACELQALAYRFGIAAPKYPFMFPRRELDGNRVFGFVRRGADKRVAVDSITGLGGTSAKPGDRAIEACPTGTLVVKRVGYAVPMGQRKFDHEPIGSDVERGAADE